MRIGRHYQNLNGIEVIWENPKDTSYIQGVLYLFHGCTHSASSWFVLPEEVKIVHQSLQKKLIVVAFSSNRDPKMNGCFDSSWPPSQNTEVYQITKAIHIWKKLVGIEKLEKVNEFGFGASAGGSFLSVLVHSYKLRAVCIHISPGVPNSLQNPTQTPISWYYMPRDERWASDSNIQKAVSILQKNNIPTSVFRSLPLSMYSNFLSDRIPWFPKSLSREIYFSLKNSDWLDSSNYLTQNPRSSQIKHFIENQNYFPSLLLPSLPSLLTSFSNNELFSSGSVEGSQNPISLVSENSLFQSLVEELNVLYGDHEMSSQFISEVLDWLLNV